MTLLPMFKREKTEEEKECYKEYLSNLWRVLVRVGYNKSLESYTIEDSIKYNLDEMGRDLIQNMNSAFDGKKLSREVETENLQEFQLNKKVFDQAKAIFGDVLSTKDFKTRKEKLNNWINLVSGKEKITGKMTVNSFKTSQNNPSLHSQGR